MEEPPQRFGLAWKRAAALKPLVFINGFSHFSLILMVLINTDNATALVDLHESAVARRNVDHGVGALLDGRQEAGETLRRLVRILEDEQVVNK